MLRGAIRMINAMTSLTLIIQYPNPPGRTMTVVFAGGSQTIAVPPNVSITEIVATSTKLAPGIRVVIPAMQRPDGTLTTSRIMLANVRASK